MLWWPEPMKICNGGFGWAECEMLRRESMVVYRRELGLIQSPTTKWDGIKITKGQIAGLTRYKRGQWKKIFWKWYVFRWIMESNQYIAKEKDGCGAKSWYIWYLIDGMMILCCELGWKIFCLKFGFGFCCWMFQKKNHRTTVLTYHGPRYESVTTKQCNLYQSILESPSDCKMDNVEPSNQWTKRL